MSLPCAQEPPALETEEIQTSVPYCFYMTCVNVVLPYTTIYVPSVNGAIKLRTRPQKTLVLA
jgi:hypothetical protein